MAELTLTRRNDGTEIHAATGLRAEGRTEYLILSPTEDAALREIFDICDSADGYTHFRSADGYTHFRKPVFIHSEQIWYARGRREAKQ